MLPLRIAGLPKILLPFFCVALPALALNAGHPAAFYCGGMPWWLIVGGAGAGAAGGAAGAAGAAAGGAGVVEGAVDGAVDSVVDIAVKPDVIVPCSCSPRRLSRNPRNSLNLKLLFFLSNMLPFKYPIHICCNSIPISCP